MDDESPESAPSSPEESDGSAPESPSENSGLLRAVLTSEASSKQTAPGALARGSSVGHYVILSQLSQSNSDSVYAAFDARLDRKVALKVIEVPPAEDAEDREDAEGDEKGETQLRREAMIASASRSSAVDHPAIVEVLDAGTVGNAVYVAMEFIDGIDLRQWMEARDDPFPWPEVLRVFREAGSALAAAHAAGVIHGDFTPSRVFMEKSGRICVFDFGLATLVEESTSPALSLQSLTEGLRSSEVEDSLIERPRAAALVGTPLYLAPETHAGIEPDAKADQFAFCAAMYEALYGEVPFKGDSRATIAAAALGHDVREAPEGADVPQWLRAVLLKGLSPRRHDRYPSMEVLLRDLEYDPHGRRRRWIAGITLLGAATIAVGSVAYLVHAEASDCEADDTLLQGAWDPATRDALQAAFLGSGQRPLSGAWEGIESSMDEWSAQWLHYRSLACNVHRADDDDRLFEARNACLDGVLQPFTAFAASGPEGPPLRGSQRVLAGLWRPEDCRSTDMHPYALPADTEAKALVDLAWLELLAGDAASAKSRAAAASAESTGLDHPSTLVRAKLIAGLAAQQLGSPDVALLLHQASASAAAASLRIPQVEAWLALSRIGAPHDRAVWLGHAQTMVEALDIDHLRPKLSTARAGLLRAQGRDDDALAEYHRALALLPDNDPRGQIERGDILLEMAELAASREEWTTASRYLDEVVDSAETSFGPMHHELLGPLAAQAKALLRSGALDASERAAERALGLSELNDASPPAVAGLHDTLASVEERRGQFPLALRHRERAVRTLEGTSNDDALAKALFSLGETELGHGSSERAVTALERASVLAARLRWQGERRVAVHETLGRALEPSDRPAALAEYRRALAAASGTRAIKLEARIEAVEARESEPEAP